MEPTSTLKIVHDCIIELTASKGVADRQAVISATGLSPHIVKERVEWLIEHGHIERRSRGHYEAVKVFHPTRPISKTALPDGVVIIEVGDTVLHLSPPEERMLRGLFGGMVIDQSAPAKSPAHAEPRKHHETMSLDDVAAMFSASRWMARDRITKEPGFPAIAPGSTWKKPRWLRSEVVGYLARKTQLAA